MQPHQRAQSVWVVGKLQAFPKVTHGVSRIFHLNLNSGPVSGALRDGMARHPLHSFISKCHRGLTTGRYYVASWGHCREQDRHGVPALLQGACSVQRARSSHGADLCAKGAEEAAPTAGSAREQRPRRGRGVEGETKRPVECSWQRRSCSVVRCELQR